MYEPVWFRDKTVRAVAEAIAVVAAGLALRTTRTQVTRDPSLTGGPP
jgi:hypothetical protein